MNSKLFAFYLGGKASGANIEVHDVVFVVGETKEACYLTLKQKWFGDKTAVHIDNYICLEQLNGYKIEAVENLNEVETPDLKLFFINFGAASVNKFTEIHDSGFFVASDKSGALKQAIKTLLVGGSDVHLDNLHIVDDVLEINLVDNSRIKLTPNTAVNSLPTPFYFKLK